LRLERQEKCLEPVTDFMTTINDENVKLSFRRYIGCPGDFTSISRYDILDLKEYEKEVFYESQSYVQTVLRLVCPHCP
jgi:hypothetical protein